MSLNVVLENWSDYDNRKMRYTDSKFFACTESWEVDYLIDKITKTYSGKSRQIVKQAIENCCSQLGPPHPREQFVQCVLKRLGLI